MLSGPQPCAALDAVAELLGQGYLPALSRVLLHGVCTAASDMQRWWASLEAVLEARCEAAVQEAGGILGHTQGAGPQPQVFMSLGVGRGQGVGKVQGRGQGQGQPQNQGQGQGQGQVPILIKPIAAHLLPPKWDARSWAEAQLLRQQLPDPDAVRLGLRREPWAF